VTAPSATSAPPAGAPAKQFPDLNPQPENLYARLPQGIVTSTVDQLFQ
jgi:hypothetical protein